MGIIKYIKNQFRHDRNMKRMLSEQNEELRQIRTLLMEQRIHAFREKTLMSKEMGISGERLCDNEVVVSLTSFGKRIYDVHLAIESIMQGTVKPNRIVLWLSEEEFKGKPLPRMLEMQKARGLQVEFCEDIRSYKKLIPALKQFLITLCLCFVIVLKCPSGCAIVSFPSHCYDFIISQNEIITKY